MIRVTIELIPFGVECNKEWLGTIDIANTGDHPRSPSEGDYAVRMISQDMSEIRTKVEDFPRIRGWFSLFYRTMCALMAERVHQMHSKNQATSEIAHYDPATDIVTGYTPPYIGTLKVGATYDVFADGSTKEWKSDDER